MIEEKDVIKSAKKFMKLFNVSPASLGYFYIEKAACLVYNNPALISGGKYGLYNELNKTLKTRNQQNISKAISNALYRGYTLTESETIDTYFGNIVSAKTGYPTNLVFIMTMLDYIMDDLERGGNNAE